MTGVKALALGLTVVGIAQTVALGSGLSGSSRYYTDAFLDMYDGPYPDADTLTGGGAKPWYDSPVVARFYGGVPNAQQQFQFEQNVAIRVLDTYRKSGVPLAITNNPNDPVPHTLSVVSGTNNPSNPDAVGITTIGGNGFTFIDAFTYANSLDELEWAVAHNVAHELMHAFGGDHHDTTGQYLDGAVTPWETLINPNATLGPDSVAELLTKDFRDPNGGYASLLSGFGGYGFGQKVEAPDGSLVAAPVPEPATVALWAVGAIGVVMARRRRAA